MSVRAYRIDKIEIENEKTFNLWHDGELMDFLDSEGCLENLNGDGCGILEVSVEQLERALEEVDNLDEETKKAIKEDIDWAKRKKGEYILYNCF